MLALVTGNAGFIGFHGQAAAGTRRLLPMQPDDVPSTFADVSLIASGVGYRPRVPVHEDVARFV